MIWITVGTRPEILKIKPLLNYWNNIGFENYKIFLTFQHKEVCEELIETLKSNEKILNNNITNIKLNNRLNQVMIETIFELESLFLKEKPDLMIVQGDTISAYSSALCCYNNKVRVAHIEAGLRSYDTDNPYPEEFYRRSISMLSSINFCPTKNNYNILIQEKVPGISYITGNTIIDVLHDKKLISSLEKIVLCTLHRRENHEKIEEWFEKLDYIAKKYKDYKFILPIHKNPSIFKFKDKFKYITCVEPLNHGDFLTTMSKCSFIITDSGGICEEGSFLKKKMFICRKETERHEAKDFFVLCETPQILNKEINLYLKDKPQLIDRDCPFGDGKASENITDVLKSYNYI